MKQVLLNYSLFIDEETEAQVGPVMRQSVVELGALSLSMYYSASPGVDQCLKCSLMYLSQTPA